MPEHHPERHQARLAQPWGLGVPDLRSVCPRTLLERRRRFPLLAVSLEEVPAGVPSPFVPPRGSWRTPAAAPVKGRGCHPNPRQPAPLAVVGVLSGRRVERRLPTNLCPTGAMMQHPPACEPAASSHSVPAPRVRLGAGCSSHSGSSNTRVRRGLDMTGVGSRLAPQPLMRRKAVITCNSKQEAYSSPSSRCSPRAPSQHPRPRPPSHNSAQAPI
jgi:hypothetical protein